MIDAHTAPEAQPHDPSLEAWAWINGKWIRVHTVLIMRGEHTVVACDAPHTAYDVWPRDMRRGDQPTEPPTL